MFVLDDVPWSQALMFQARVPLHGGPGRHLETLSVGVNGQRLVAVTRLLGCIWCLLLIGTSSVPNGVPRRAWVVVRLFNLIITLTLRRYIT